jgi:DNA polymerase III epsilon subunit family exonuclease
LRSVPVAVLDFEMTGLDPERDRVCEVAVVRGTFDGAASEFQSLVRPSVPMSKASRRLTGITDNMLQRAPGFRRVAHDLVDALDGAVVVCHNVPFDIGFLHRELDEIGVGFAPPVTLDTLLMARRLFAFPRNTLTAVCENFGIAHASEHRALGDARATFEVYRAMVEAIDPNGDVTVRDLLDLLGALAPDSPLRLQQQRELALAFRQRRTVLIDYHAASDPRMGPVRREVGIWALALPLLQGWCYLRAGERVFRLDRIRRVEATDRTYEIPEFVHRI